MNLKLEVRKTDLIISAVAVSAVNIGLLRKAMWIRVGEGFHELNGLGVFVDVGLIDGVSCGSDAERRGGREGEIDYLVRYWWAAIYWCSTGW